jgi:hypothetical protein
MKMKTSHALLAVVLGCSVAGCVSLPKLDYYRPGYDPGFSEALRFDGYYAREDYSRNTSPPSIEMYFFYPDGSLKRVPPSFTERFVLEMLRDMPAREPTFEGWGFYKIEDGVMYLEGLTQTDSGCMCRDRWAQKVTITPNTITVIEEFDQNTKTFLPRPPRTLTFKDWSIRPDPAMNQIIHTGKYQR